MRQMKIGRLWMVLGLLVATACPSSTPTPTPSALPCGAVTWANAVNVAVNGNNLQKTAGGAAWNAGAVSSTQLTAGDGAAQLQVDGTAGYRVFGLSTADPDQNYTSVRYALSLTPGGPLSVFESGVSPAQVGTYAAGDLLKVEVSGGVVRYARKAAGSSTWSVLYTSTLAPMYPLMLDTSLFTVGARIQNAYFGAGACP